MGAKEKARAKSRRDEIVGELVNLLVPDGDESDRFSSEFVVLSTIQFIQQSNSKKPLWGFAEANSKSLSALSKNIRDLRKTLADAPGETLLLLAGADPSDQFPLARKQQVLLDRLKQIVGMLGFLQRRCDELHAQKVGGHRGADFSQRMVAEEAWRLMRYHDLTPASGISDSTFGMVATLLFEAATGENDKDLQRACKAALERAKDGKLTEWRGL
jgi:hypothetical protein